MHEGTMVNDMHTVMLFSGPISLEVTLWSGVALHMMRGQNFIFLTLTLRMLWCIEYVLLNYIMPCMPFVCADSLFMQDSMHPHVT